MEETKKKSKNAIIGIVITIIVIASVSVCIWYFQVKKPHDEAVNGFNTATETVEVKNAELDSVIADAQSLMDEANKPYDENTISELTVSIADAENAKRTVPELPSKTSDIISATKMLKEPIDYSSFIDAIKEKQSALENSILQMRQITAPTESFVIQRIADVEGISGVQAVTEDHDPNGNLNKAGGYTACIYFSSSLINQDEVFGNDIVEKGTDCGGCIEVYPTIEEAEKRNTYLFAFDGAGMLDSGSHNILGSIVIRTSRTLTATQQNELTQKISEKLLELQ